MDEKDLCGGSEPLSSSRTTGTKGRHPEPRGCFAHEQDGRAGLGEAKSAPEAHGNPALLEEHRLHAGPEVCPLSTEPAAIRAGKHQCFPQEGEKHEDGWGGRGGPRVTTLCC